MRVYMTCVRPILTYMAETSNIKSLLWIVEIKTLRAVKGPHGGIKLEYRGCSPMDKI